VRPRFDGLYPIERAGEAYAVLASETHPIGVLLDYHLEAAAESRLPRVYLPRRSAAREAPAGQRRVGVVGFGSYFRSVLLPLLKEHPGFALTSVCARNGLTVRQAVEKDGFARGTTDYRELVLDPEVQAVFVTTRHDQHYPIARAAIEAGKAVFVEKPMTMTAAEGRALSDLVAERKGLLTVGFNRRFSPHARELKRHLAPIAEPRRMIYRVNAAALPPDHWLRDPVEGGGRLLGEGVHFFDFLAFLSGARPARVHAISPPGLARDDGIVSVAFEDGSIGTVVYTAAGSPASGKERVEVYAGGASFVLDDYRSLYVHGVPGRGLETRRVEKGQREQLDNFWRALEGREDLQVTAEDGYWATWCAERATSE
jgi:predicted dehydrogenase